MSQDRIIKAVVIGASGYTGAELVRLLVGHPYVEIVALVGDSTAGQAISDLYQHFSVATLPTVGKRSDVSFEGVDVVFCCLPHATSQAVIAELPSYVKVIDLSADFRIRDAATYEAWYGVKHQAAELQEKAVYGLTEHARDAVRDARLVACPGCYPTSMLLPLLPLIRRGVIDPQRIIVDSKSGITGAGRAAKVANLYAEVNGTVRPYGLGGHRHVVEVEQELNAVSDADIRVTFTPQVVPMNRGILSTIYVESVSGQNVESIKEILHETYANEPFVSVVEHVPTNREVYGTNRCVIHVTEDRVPGRVILVSAIDNLLKGASGQAVQNLNVMFGLPETEGLQRIAIFP